MPRPGEALFGVAGGSDAEIRARDFESSIFKALSGEARALYLRACAAVLRELCVNRFLVRFGCWM
jgi:hypothetical protein